MDYEEMERFKDVRDRYQQTLREGGTCPCCGRFNKIYRRTFNKTMLHALQWILDQANGRVGVLVNVPAAARRTGAYDVSKQYSVLKWWGVIAAGPKQGLWRVTPLGYGFIEGTVSIPIAVYTLDGVVVDTDSVKIYASDVDSNYDHVETMAPVGDQIDMFNSGGAA